MGDGGFVSVCVILSVYYPGVDSPHAQAGYLVPLPSADLNGTSGDGWVDRKVTRRSLVGHTEGLRDPLTQWRDTGVGDVHAGTTRDAVSWDRLNGRVSSETSRS